MKKELKPTDKNFLRKYNGYIIYQKETAESKKIAIACPDTDNDAPHVFESEPWDPNDSHGVNRGIEQAKEWINKLKRCRVCGCTEHNCKQCIEKTGGPCSWVEEDLCSACMEEPKVIVKDTRAVSDEHPVVNETESIVDVVQTNFFSSLVNAKITDFTARVRVQNGKMIIELIPGAATGEFKPLRFEGSPEDFDNEFFSKVVSNYKEVEGLKSNFDSVKEQFKSPKKEIPAKENKAASKPIKKSSPVKQKPAKPKPKPEKKAAPAKKVKPKVKPEKKVEKEKVEKVDETPSGPVEQHLF